MKSGFSILLALGLGALLLGTGQLRDAVEARREPVPLPGPVRPGKEPSGTPARMMRTAPSTPESRPATRDAPVTTEPAPRPGAVQPAAIPRLPHGRQVTGWVVDPEGRAIGGARVTPWRADGLALCLDRERSTESDAAGRFDIRVDPSGPGRIAVEHPDHLTWDGELPPSESPTVVLERPASLLGRVEDAAGEPVPDALVLYMTPGLRNARRSVAVDAGGHFRVDGLPPGSVELQVRGPRGSLGPVPVAVGEPEEVVLVLDETRALRVLVQSADGKPLAGARVALLPAGESRAVRELRTSADGEARFSAAPAAELSVRVEHPRGLFVPRALVPHEGAVTLRSKPCGTLLLEPRGAHPLDVLLQRVPDPLAEGPLRLRATPGRPLRCEPLAAGTWTVRWCLPGGSLAAAAETEREVRVSAGGLTLLALGAPPATALRGRLAWPLAQAVSAQLWPVTGDRPLAEVPIDGEGRFRFEAVPAGRWTLGLCAAGGGSWRDPRTWELAGQDELEVRLDPPADAVRLTVRDSDGNPLATATAALVAELPARPVRPAPPHAFDGSRVVAPRAAHPPARADSSGVITLDLVPPGTTAVLVDAPGFSPLRRALPAHGRSGITVLANRD